MADNNEQPEPLPDHQVVSDDGQHSEQPSEGVEEQERAEEQPIERQAQPVNYSYHHGGGADESWNSWPQQQAMAVAHYNEALARMRDHAAAYASAASSAAWAASQLANQASIPPMLPPPAMLYGPPPMWNGPPPPEYYASYEEEGRPGKRHQPGLASSMSFESHPSRPSQDATSERRGRRRQRDYSSSDGGGRGGGKRPSKAHYSSDEQYNKKKHRRKGENNLLGLLGKTGVSALHEFCDKLKRTLKFVLLEDSPRDYIFSVQVDSQECGRGRAGTKAAAKQDAARRALQALVPGVDFDENGILIDLPDASLHTTALNSTRSANTGRDKIDDSKRRRKQYEVYPGTSTTSGEDEDENEYFASRGASVCSALLHAMWQIDERIQEQPSYAYELCANPAPAQSKRRKGPSSADGSTFTVHRSSFICTARLELHTQVGANSGESAVTKPDTGTDSDGGAKDLEGGEDAKVAANETKQAANAHQAGDTTIQQLVAVGTGATKREARHVASAKLLSMLFPDCNGMVEVKAAAEAAREKHAAQRAHKQQLERKAIFAHTRPYSRRRRRPKEPRTAEEEKASSLAFALPTRSDPALPNALASFLSGTLGFRPGIETDELEGVNVGSLSLSDSPSLNNQVPPQQVVSPRKDNLTSKRDADPAITRQKQLEYMVDLALQMENAHDEERREVDSDDVGRTVLRLAESGDLKWIYKLLPDSSIEQPAIGTPGISGCQSKLEPSGPFSLLSNHYKDDGLGSSNISSRLWGPSTVILLLCRAIAPLDEPPLGCAILTLGFSLKGGRTLRVASIGSEPHLPRERFVECLESFATNMKCALDVSIERPDTSEKHIPSEELKEIVESHLTCRTKTQERGDKSGSCDSPSIPSEELREMAESHLTGRAKTTDENSNDIPKLKSSGGPLQSVKEEDTEVLDEKERHEQDDQN